MRQLRKLFEPINVGQVELKNRIVMLCANACDRAKGARGIISYFAERAKGGAALIMVGGMLPLDLGTADRRGFKPRELTEEERVARRQAALDLYSDELIPWLRELTKVIHDNGARAGAQIYITYEWKRNWRTDKEAPTEVVGASNVPSGPHMGEARALTVDEIHQIVEEFGDAARRAREAGFDLLEIHGGIGYLVNRFLSTRSNKRTDEYGGSPEKRLRFLLEILESCRRKAGNDIPINVRLSADEFMEGGNTLKDTKQIAVMLEQAGVTAIDVQAGWHECPVPLIQQWTSPGSFVYLAEEIKKVVNIPIICGYRIDDPVLAERIVAEGRADLVGMGRALIADPELPNKAREGRFDEIRYCTACCRCLDLSREGKPPGCSVNARSAREADYIMKPAADSRKVLVIGGGPAGMEAAMVAAHRGHKVTLSDRGRRLGGSLLLAGVLNPELPRFREYQEGQVRRLPIDVKLNTNITAAFVEQMKPDVVIVATGGMPPTIEIPGMDRDNVLTGHDMVEAMMHPPSKGGLGQKLLWRLSSLILRYWYRPALIRWGLRFGFPFKKRVVIIGGGFAGCEVADVLAERGKKVTILEESPRMAYDIGVVTRWVVLQRLKKFGVQMEKNAQVIEITKKGAKATVDGTEKFFRADTVVLAPSLVADERLAQKLEGKGWVVHSIGDCAAPGKTMEAVATGFRAGYEV